MSTPSAENRFELDDIFKLHIGEFGRYQQILYIGLGLLTIPVIMPIYIMVFASAVPTFQCVAPPTAANSTACSVNECCANCTAYEYRGTFTSVVSEWDLNCDRAHISATSNSIFMAGMLVGSALFGTISDVFGRKRAIGIGIVLIIVFGVGSSLADCLSMFILFRFCVGATSIGTFLVIFVYVMEMVGPSVRTRAGKLNAIFVGVVAQSVLILTAYYIREWRYVMLTMSLPGLLFLPAWRIFPESSRWLIANDRIDEAQRVLEKYARVNGAKIDSEELASMIKDVRQNQIEQTRNTKKPNFLDLFRGPRIRKITLISLFNWAVNSMLFYGFLLNVKNLAGNIYLNYFIYALIEVPSTLMSWFMLQKLGRRFSYASYMFIGGTSCIIIVAVPAAKRSSELVFALALVGKFFTFASFTSLYIITSELMPTVIRNLGIGVSSVGARVGSITAPYIVYMGTQYRDSAMPLIIFGAFSLASGLLSLWLPETLLAYMPETLEEVETSSQDFSLPFCKRKQAKNLEELNMQTSGTAVNETSLNNESSQSDVVAGGIHLFSDTECTRNETTKV